MNNPLKRYSVIALFISLLAIHSLMGREMMRVNENENGHTIYLKTGDALEVMLRGNPTTGYTWNVEHLDSAILKQGASDFISASGGLGSAGTELLRFEAIAAGQTILTLHYARPFEKKLTPAQSFKLTIVVSNP